MWMLLQADQSQVLSFVLHDVEQVLLGVFQIQVLSLWYLVIYWFHIIQLILPPK